MRVLVWRRLRSAGAASLQNGVWVLPDRPEQERILQDLLAELSPQNGTGMVFRAELVDPTLEDDIVRRFRDDRALEYAEFAGRCRDFLAEMERETANQNFTFAELEENEQDLHKLAGWLDKIGARDFFPGAKADEAAQALDQCREVLAEFANTVYVCAGVTSDTEDETDVGSREGGPEAIGTGR